MCQLYVQELYRGLGVGPNCSVCIQYHFSVLDGSEATDKLDANFSENYDNFLSFFFFSGFTGTFSSSTM
jgi:hypothetical protein